MSCKIECLEKCFKSGEEDEKEKNYFNNMKNGLKNSIDNIKETLQPIEDWDELLNLNSEEEEKKKDNKENSKLNKSKTSIQINQEGERKIINFYSFWSDLCTRFNNSKCCLIFSFICGFFFCIIQLIGVQLGIIILNALFNKIVD